LAETEGAEQGFYFSGEHKIAPVTRKDALYYFFSLFYFVGFFVCWIIFVAILNGVFGASIFTVILSAIASSALSIWLQRRVRDRQKTESAVVQFEIAIDSSGIRVVRGRAVTYYSWEDIKSIDPETDPIRIAIVGEKNELKLSRSAFEGEQMLSDFVQFVNGKLSTITVGNA
jgi:hypothetical protein